MPLTIIFILLFIYLVYMAYNVKKMRNGHINVKRSNYNSESITGTSEVLLDSVIYDSTSASHDNHTHSSHSSDWSSSSDSSSSRSSDSSSSSSSSWD